jgi:hypothetical protein
MPHARSMVDGVRAIGPRRPVAARVPALHRQAKSPRVPIGLDDPMSWALVLISEASVLGLLIWTLSLFAQGPARSSPPFAGLDEDVQTALPVANEVDGRRLTRPGPALTR